jgi:hypothetical protein
MAEVRKQTLNALTDRSGIDSHPIDRLLWLVAKRKPRLRLLWSEQQHLRAADGNKKGLLTEPLSSCADQDLDQSLKRPRTPTRVLPPRLSLPKLRG